MNLLLQVTNSKASLWLLHSDTGPEVPDLAVFQGNTYCL